MRKTDTQTDIKTTPDSLEDLEFEPGCVVITVMALSPVPRKCENPAKWVGYSPCCSIPVLVCDPHHATVLPFFCETCKKHFSTLTNWHLL